MAVFESPIVYSMIARDALIVLPLRWRKEMDTTNLREEERVALRRQPRVTKPLIDQLHPVLEDAILRPITQETSPTSHHFVEPGRDELTLKIVDSMNVCAAAWASQAGAAQRIGSLGLLAHRVIDAWSPFSMLDDGELATSFRERFMADLTLHIGELPFLWELLAERNVKSVVASTPFDSADMIRIHMERRTDVVTPIANGYLCGNGYPAIWHKVHEWYDTMVNGVAKVWLHCIMR